jgi:hypothetical protein
METCQTQAAAFNPSARYPIEVDSTAELDQSVSFQGAIHQRRIGKVDIAHIEAQGQCRVQTKATLAREFDEYFLLSIQRSGEGRLRQDGREAVMQSGEMAFCSSKLPYELSFSSSFSQTVIIFPADVIRAIRPGLDALTGITLGSSNPLLNLLRDTADRFFEIQFERTGAINKDHACDKLCHLFAAAVAESGFAMASHPMASQMMLAQR